MQKDAPEQLITLRGVDEIEHVHDTICAALESQDYSSHDIFCVRLALDESLNNAIRHGNDMDSSKKVRVGFRVQPQQVWIQIEDEGEGFRVDEVPNPTQPQYLDQPGGRGLYVMKSFMCSVQYNERGNCVTLCKSRSVTTADAVSS